MFLFAKSTILHNMAQNNMFIERRIHKSIRDHLDKRQITVITGMRRVGKTTLIERLLEDIPSSNKAYIDLEKITNRVIFDEKNYDNVLLRLKEYFGVSFEERAYIAIDEIQLSPNITSVLKYLYDHNDIKFIITGSSSFYIKNLFTESMAGRKLIFEIYPLDFGEFLDFKNVVRGATDDFLAGTMNVSVYEDLKEYYEEFIEYGGFPEVVLEESYEQKKKLLLDIIDSYVNLDIASISDFKDERETYALMKMLSARVGSRLDYLKLSRLSQLPRERVLSYLDFFEATYLIHRVPVFTTNNDREIVKAKKLYFSDTGIANVLSDLDGGSKFENTVYNQLKHFGDVSYYSLKNGREIDFILKKSKEGPIALETKEIPLRTDLNNVVKLANIAGIKQSRLIGRHFSPDFPDYIWGGSIR